VARKNIGPEEAQLPVAPTDRLFHLGHLGRLYCTTAAGFQVLAALKAAVLVIALAMATRNLSGHTSVAASALLSPPTPLGEMPVCRRRSPEQTVSARRCIEEAPTVFQLQRNNLRRAIGGGESHLLLGSTAHFVYESALRCCREKRRWWLLRAKFYGWRWRSLLLG